MREEVEKKVRISARLIENVEEEERWEGFGTSLWVLVSPVSSTGPQQTTDTVRGVDGKRNTGGSG